MSNDQRNLTSKSIFGVVSDMLENTARIAVNLVITPWIIRLLGKELYGVWAMISQLNGYIALGNLRLSATVKFYIATQQHSSETGVKRRMVGASLLGAFISLPLLGLLIAGAIYFSPRIFRIPDVHAQEVRLTLLITGALVVLTQFLSIPGNVLRGMNQDYRALGAKSLALIVSSILGLVLVAYDWGLPGLALANLLGYLLLSGVQITLAIRYIEWLGMEWPKLREMREYLGNSLWVFVTSIGQLLLTGSDYLLAGYFLTPSNAAIYSVTATLTRLLLSPLASLSNSTNAGLSGLCGAKEWARLLRAKHEYYVLTFLITGVAGGIVLFANRAFVGLWVGPTFYGGGVLTLLFLLQGICTAVTQVDSNLFDGLMAIRQKALITLSCGVVTILAAVSLVPGLGLVGIGLGVLIGRVLSCFLHRWYLMRHGLGNNFEESFPVRLLVVLAACWLGAACFPGSVDLTWLEMIASCGLLAAAATVAMYALGANATQKRLLKTRFSNQVARFTRKLSR